MSITENKQLDKQIKNKPDITFLLLRAFLISPSTDFKYFFNASLKKQNNNKKSLIFCIYFLDIQKNFRICCYISSKREF